MHCVLKSWLRLNKVKTILILGQPRLDLLRKANDRLCCFQNPLSSNAIQGVQGFAEIASVVVQANGVNTSPITAKQERVGVKEPPTTYELNHVTGRKGRIRSGGGKCTGGAWLS